MTTHVSWIPDAAILGVADVFIETTIILSIGGAIAALMRNSSAARRAGVWSAAFAAALLVPAIKPFVPAWSVSVAATTAAVDTERVRVGVPPAAQTVVTDIGTRPVAVGSQSTAWRFIPASLGIIWLLGVAALLSRLLLHYIRIRRITTLAPAAGAHVRRVAAICRRSMGFHRLAPILVSDAIAAPASAGAIRPVIVLPTESNDWPSVRLRAVLTHEFAHVMRRDHLVHLMVETACALFWLNPIIWIAARRVHAERERACDDLAIGTGVSAADYATELLALAGREITQVPSPALTMAQRSGLAERIRVVLSNGTNRRPVGRAGAMLIAALTVAVTVPVAAFQVFGGRQAPTLDELISSLSDDDPAVRRRAAWALGERENPTAVPALIEQLTAGTPDVRLVAAWALGEIKDPRAVAPLAERIGDEEDPLVQEMAALALGETEHPSVVGALVNAAGQDPSLEPAVVWALGEIETEEAAAARRVLGDDTPHSEVWTGSGVSFVTQGIGTVESLLRELRSTNPSARRAAAMQLGLLDDDRAIDPLLDTLRDPVPAVRAMAVWALDEINPSRRLERN